MCLHQGEPNFLPQDHGNIVSHVNACNFDFDFLADWSMNMHKFIMTTLLKINEFPPPVPCQRQHMLWRHNSLQAQINLFCMPITWCATAYNEEDLAGGASRIILALKYSPITLWHLLWIPHPITLCLCARCEFTICPFSMNLVTTAYL